MNQRVPGYTWSQYMTLILKIDFLTFCTPITRLWFWRTNLFLGLLCSLLPLAPLLQAQSHVWMSLLWNQGSKHLTLKPGMSFQAAPPGGLAWSFLSQRLQRELPQNKLRWMCFLSLVIFKWIIAALALRSRIRTLVFYSNNFSVRICYAAPSPPIHTHLHPLYINFSCDIASSHPPNPIFCYHRSSLLILDLFSFFLYPILSSFPWTNKPQWIWKHEQMGASHQELLCSIDIYFPP